MPIYLHGTRHGYQVTATEPKRWPRLDDKRRFWSWPGTGRMWLEQKGRLLDFPRHEERPFARVISEESARAIAAVDEEIKLAEERLRELRRERNEVCEAAAARGKPVRPTRESNG